MSTVESPVDTVVEPMLEVPKPQVARPRRACALKRRKRYSLLIVRGDGTRVLRVNFPRPAAVGALAAVLVLVSAFGTLLGDWVQLRQLTREARTFRQQAAEQRVTIDAFNRRVAELRGEVGGWRDLQARIWDAFGPEVTPGGRDRGIGGATLAATSATAGLPAKLTPRDELERLAEVVLEQGQSLRELERLMARAGKVLAALPSRWPIRGTVNSEFGRRLSPWTKAPEFHGGLDIRTTMGSPIKAPARGTVAFIGTQGDYGTTVILDHGQDLRTLYGHLSAVKVKPGEAVERGAVIGLAGNSGRSTGPHLHYEILVKGQAVNPRAWLWD